VLTPYFVTRVSSEALVCDVMSADAAILRLAARQHGVVKYAQLVSAGLDPKAIARRVADGRLRRLHRGVYLAAPLPARFTPEMAAVLACGDSAVLSHHAAAALWGFRPPWQGDVDVTVTKGQARHRQGITVHRARLEPRDVRRRHDIPLTSPARTLRDLAPHLPQRDLDRTVEQAQVLRLVSRRELLHVPALRRALRHEPALTRSEAEARLLDLVRAAGLPTPATNVRIAGYEVDLLWRTHRLIVEVDGSTPLHP
jgi:hypothetical protein